jgi:hypothetical protein
MIINKIKEEDIMKFDCVIGNPPFQPPIKKEGKGIGTGSKIWQKFVEIGFNILVENGIIAFITPYNWRIGKTNNGLHRKAQQIMWSNNILEFKPVNKYFSVGGNISMDYWIITKDKTIKGIEIDPFLKDIMFLPYIQEETVIEFLKLTKDHNEKLFELNIHSNDNRRPNAIKKQKRGNEISLYPHINTISQYERGFFDWYSEKTDNFDNKKVIISDSTSKDMAIYDYGMYGCGKHSSGYLVSNEIEAKKLINFLNNSAIVKKIFELSSSGFSKNYSFLTKIPKSWVERFNNGEDL